MHPKPTLLFDGDCGFCKTWIRYWQSLTGSLIRYVPFQNAAKEYPQLSREALSKAIHFIDSNGQVTTGAHAVFDTLNHARHPLGLWCYTHIPGFKWMSEYFYMVVAQNRTVFSLLTKWFIGNSPEPLLIQKTRWLFLRGFGLVSMLVFASLIPQIQGLFGSQGILPIQDYILHVEKGLGVSRFWQYPTLLWTFHSDMI
ncbi:MAG: DUF393 domain-containing protein, partial [Candidatus Margulisbacteria bacterium]|nr:DUF393 domain-containing protein [Candidatus Margulisiibacteriota bacterium]